MSWALCPLPARRLSIQWFLFVRCVHFYAFCICATLSRVGEFDSGYMAAANIFETREIFVDCQGGANKVKNDVITMVSSLFTLWIQEGNEPKSNIVCFSYVHMTIDLTGKLLSAVLHLKYGVKFCNFATPRFAAFSVMLQSPFGVAGEHFRREPE